MSYCDFVNIITILLKNRNHIYSNSVQPKSFIYGKTQNDSFHILLFQTNDFWDFAEANKKGSTNFFLNLSDFEKYEFNLPSIDSQVTLTSLFWKIQETLKSEKAALKEAVILRNPLYEETQSKSYFDTHSIPYHVGTVGNEFSVCNNFRKPLSQAVRSEIQGPYAYWGPTGILDHINEYRLDGEYALTGEDGNRFLKYRD